jgi:transcription elongation factor Elf1
MEIAEHVRRLRRMLRIVVTCPRCGREGIVSVLERGRYKYLVVRHGDGSTHTLSQHIDVVLEELCRIRKELEQVCNLKGA